MANTGYKINPFVTQVFTSGPNSGSEVSPSFIVTFNTGSGFISSSLCGNQYYYKTYEPYNCIVPSLCIPPILSSASVQFCNSSYNYTYQFDLNAGSSSLEGVKIEYSLNPSFSGEIKSTTITDYSGSINPLIVNISNGDTNRSEISSSGLSGLPLNQYSSVYFRAYSICSGSNSSSYSNIQEGKCENYSNCRQLLSFDYKGVGSVTFRYKLCGETTYSQFTFTGLVNSGGMFYTHVLEPDFGEPILCIENGTFERIGGSISNTNNYIYGTTSCTP